MDREDDAREADRRRIRFLLNHLSAAWNVGDAAFFAEAFKSDCDYVAFDGSHVKGQSANAEHHRRLFETILRGSKLVYEGVPQIRFLSNDIALMHAMGSVLMPWQEKVHRKRRSYQTYVMIRQPGQDWRIAAFHNSRYRPLRLPRGVALKFVLALIRMRARFAK